MDRVLWGHLSVGVAVPAALLFHLTYERAAVSLAVSFRIALIGMGVFLLGAILSAPTILNLFGRDPDLTGRSSLWAAWPWAEDWDPLRYRSASHLCWDKSVRSCRPHR